MTRHTASQLAEMLAARAGDVARTLLPDGKQQAGEWYASGTRSPTGYAISVVTRGPKMGVCGFFGGEKPGGDLLDLIRVVHGCSTVEAMREARRLLGISDHATPEASARLEEEAERRRLAREKEAEADEASRIAVAREIWEACGAMGPATPAWKYLERRGIPADLISRRLGAHWSLRHPSGGHYPALVGRLQAPEDGGPAFRGVWRIFLTEDGRKAPVEPQKLGLGRAQGAAVYLTQTRPVMHVAEGIESALGVLAILRRLMAVEDEGVCAALSAPGMEAWEPPPATVRVVVWPDGDTIREDKKGRLVAPRGQTAAQRLVDRLTARGMPASLPHPSFTGRDPLDMWLRLRGGACA